MIIPSANPSIARRSRRDEGSGGLSSSLLLPASSSSLLRRRRHRRRHRRLDHLGDPPVTQKYLPDDSNDGVITIVPILPFRLVLSNVVVVVVVSPSSSSEEENDDAGTGTTNYSAHSSSWIDSVIGCVESYVSDAFSSSDAYGTNFDSLDVGGDVDVVFVREEEEGEDDENTVVLSPTSLERARSPSSITTTTTTTTATTTTTTTLVLTLGIDGSVTFDGPYWNYEYDPTPRDITSFIVRDVDTMGLRRRLIPIVCATTTADDGTEGYHYDDDGCDFGAELSFSIDDDEEDEEDEQRGQDEDHPSGGTTIGDASGGGGDSANVVAVASASAAATTSVGADSFSAHDSMLGIVVPSVVCASTVVVIAIAGLVSYHRRRQRRRLSGEDDRKEEGDGVGGGFAANAKRQHEGGAMPPVVRANDAVEDDGGGGGGTTTKEEGGATRNESAKKKIDDVLDDLVSADSIIVSDSSSLDAGRDGGVGSVDASFVPSGPPNAPIIIGTSGNGDDDRLPPLRPRGGESSRRIIGGDDDGVTRKQEPFEGTYRTRGVMATLNLKKDMLQVTRETYNSPDVESVDEAANYDEDDVGDPKDRATSTMMAGEGAASASSDRGYSGVNRTVSPKKSTNMMEMQRLAELFSLRGMGDGAGHGRSVNKKHPGGQRRNFNKTGGDDKYGVGEDLLPVAFLRSDSVDLVDLRRSKSTDSSSDGSGQSNDNFSWV